MQNTGQYIKTKQASNGDTYNTTTISFRQRVALLVNILRRKHTNAQVILPQARGHKQRFVRTRHFVDANKTVYKVFVLKML